MVVEEPAAGIHERLGLVHLALREQVVHLQAELAHLGVEIDVHGAGGGGRGRAVGAAGELDGVGLADEVGDLAAGQVGGGFVQGLGIAAFAPLLAEREEGEVVVHPLVRGGLDEGLVGTVVADDGGIGGDSADGDDKRDRVLGVGLALDLLDVPQGEVVLEEGVAGARDAVARGAHEEAGRVRELEIDGGPDEADIPEKGETAGEAGAFDGFVDARFDEPFDVVLVGCALVGEGVDEGEVGGVVVKGGTKGAGEAEVLGERARGVVAFGVRTDAGA